MKKLLFISLTSLALSSFNLADAYVYICNSETSTKYHYKSDCRGLNACKHEVVKITKEEAVNSGHSLCGWED